jgi:hypothetical protein
MKSDLKTIESLRQQLFAIRTRARDLDANAVTYRKSPYATPEAVVLFAQAVAQQVLTLVAPACERIAVLENSVHEPVSEYHDLWFQNRCESQSEKSGASVEATAEANIAVAQHFIALANDQLNHAQACLEREVTVDGRKINHGPLWDK